MRQRYLVVILWNQSIFWALSLPAVVCVRSTYETSNQFVRRVSSCDAVFNTYSPYSYENNTIIPGTVQYTWYIIVIVLCTSYYDTYSRYCTVASVQSQPQNHFGCSWQGERWYWASQCEWWTRKLGTRYDSSTLSCTVNRIHTVCTSRVLYCCCYAHMYWPCPDAIVDRPLRVRITYGDTPRCRSVVFEQCQ